MEKKKSTKDFDSGMRIGVGGDDYVPILEPRKHSILRIALRGVHVDSSFAAQDVPLNRKVRQWPHRETNAVRKRCAHYVGVVETYRRGE